MVDINFLLLAIPEYERDREERGENIFYDMHLRTQNRDNIALIDGDKPSDLAAVLA